MLMKKCSDVQMRIPFYIPGKFSSVQLLLLIHLNRFMKQQRIKLLSLIYVCKCVCVLPS